MRNTSRDYWLQTLERLAAPVLENAAARELHAKMPQGQAHLAPIAPLAATSRILNSLAPWLDLENLGGEERELQTRFRTLARAALVSVVNPDSPDYAPVEAGSQVLVEGAKLAQTVLYGRAQLWDSLDSQAQNNLVRYFEAMRAIRPGFNNWLLFAAMNEAALCALGQSWDAMRVDYALRQHEQWYLGDGVYSDGPHHRFDYYNSLVMHPLLLNILNCVGDDNDLWKAMRPPVLRRARRHAVLMERQISPEGTFPPVGRSLGYRCGVFHGLAHLSLMRELPETLPPSQVRCALEAVMRRTLDAPGTFDAEGWLQQGFCGAQPSINEPYLSRASSYLCAIVLLPLGLPASDAFWSGEDLPWTARRLWNGEDIPADKASD